MKQQGHLYDVNVIDFSPNGDYMVSGGDEGKVKVWNLASSMCVSTFSEHTAPVTGVCY